MVGPGGEGGRGEDAADRVVSLGVGLGGGCADEFEEGVGGSRSALGFGDGDFGLRGWAFGFGNSVFGLMGRFWGLRSGNFRVVG